MPETQGPIPYHYTALELLVLAVGAKVILACCMACCRSCCKAKPAHSMARMETTRTDEASTYPKGEHCKQGEHKCYGFLKATGYFTIVMSVVALVFTCVALSFFLMDAKRLEKESNGSVQQYNHNVDKLQKYSGNYLRLPVVVQEPVNTGSTK